MRYNELASPYALCSPPVLSSSWCCIRLFIHPPLTVPRSPPRPRSTATMHSIVEVLGTEEPTSKESQTQGQQEGHKLFEAVTNGDLEQVKSLLPTSSTSSNVSADSPSLSVNISDSAGFTPLIIAARRGHESIVSYLLSLPNIDVNARTSKGNTALFYAAAKNNVNIVRMLIEGGANLFVTNMNQDNVIMCAALGGDEGVFTYFQEVYHSIRTAKLPPSQHRPWEQGKAQQKRFFTTRNEEGLTLLMCGVMGRSEKIVKEILKEVRHELGIYTGSKVAPSALKEFYPTIWDSVLGPINFQERKGGYRDPAPVSFQTYVSQSNVMGDCALHICAENQAVELYLFLLEYAGADPMRINRRGKRTFELFKIKLQNDGKEGGATVTEIKDGEDDASADASTSTTVSIQDRITDHIEKILTFQRSLREKYLREQAKVSEQLFSQLMEEEEEQVAAQGKKGGQQQKGKGGAAKKNKKKNNAVTQSPTIVAQPTPTDEDRASSDEEEKEINSDDEDTTTTKDASSTTTGTSALTSSPSASPVLLSSKAALFIPLAELAAIDAKNGWETVTTKPHKKKQTADSSTLAVSSASTSSHTTQQPAKSKKKVTTEANAEVTSPKRKKKNGSESKKQKQDEKRPATVGESSSTAASISTSTPSSSITPSTSSIPATSGPSRWRPIVALNRTNMQELKQEMSTHADTPSSPKKDTNAPFMNTSPLSSPTSSASTLSTASLYHLFTSLHPHIESTDLQLDHFLGSSWSTLSVGQLNCLEEIYTSLGRLVREEQNQRLQASQNEMRNEIVKMRSEMNAMRREMEKRNKES